MLKVVVRGTRHPDTLHYLSRALVGWNGKGNNLREPEMGEAMVTRCASSLTSKTEAPIIACQPPSDLHARSEVRLEARQIFVAPEPKTQVCSGQHQITIVRYGGDSKHAQDRNPVFLRCTRYCGQA
jgi:hypothetical protein